MTNQRPEVGDTVTYRRRGVMAGISFDANGNQRMTTEIRTGTVQAVRADHLVVGGDDAPEWHDVPLGDVLDDRQLDGLACIRCGLDLDTTASVPVGHGEHNQVFACASHTEWVEVPLRDVLPTIAPLADLLTRAADRLDTITP